jgi:hypothetical protein
VHELVNDGRSSFRGVPPAAGPQGREPERERGRERERPPSPRGQNKVHTIGENWILALRLSMLALAAAFDYLRLWRRARRWARCLVDATTFLPST